MILLIILLWFVTCKPVRIKWNGRDDKDNNLTDELLVNISQ